MHIIVCGGRRYSDRTIVFGALDAIHRLTPVSLVIHGGCSGADEIAHDWARRREVFEMACYAPWRARGDAAGPWRNAKMLEYKPELVVAFPGEHGTANMMRLAKDAGVEVRKVGW